MRNSHGLISQTAMLVGSTLGQRRDNSTNVGPTNIAVRDTLSPLIVEYL